VALGTYNIVENKYQGMSANAGYDDDGNGIDSKYYLNVPGSGQVEITLLDTAKGVIGGTFSFTVIEGTEELIITEGKFQLPIE
jgi:hypothetical protein